MRLSRNIASKIVFSDGVRLCKCFHDITVARNVDCSLKCQRPHIGQLQIRRILKCEVVEKTLPFFTHVLLCRLVIIWKRMQCLCYLQGIGGKE